jgi:cytochrome P450 family 6
MEKRTQHFSSEPAVLFTGMLFGLMQVKAGLIHVLSSYEVAPCKDTPVPIVYDPKSFLLLTQGKMPLSFKRI